MADSEDAEDDASVETDVAPAESSAPAVGSVLRDRFSSDEVFQRIVAEADEEITSGRRELFFSAVAAGLAITITFLLYASMTASTDGHPIWSAMLYPLGFIYIIIGGYQLYTENTLPPVALSLERLASLPALFRHWLIVLAGNFAGGAIGAVVLAWGGVFSPEALETAVTIAGYGVETPKWDLFFKGAVAGLIVAGVVWMVYAATDTISRIVVVYLAFLAIPLGNLFHVVVSFTEATFLVLRGELGVFVGMTEFVIPVLLGNTIGGVVLVTIVNYYQTSERRLQFERFETDVRKLSVREWTFGPFVGRSYVPLIDTHGPTAESDAYRLMVPISNPRTEGHLVDLAATIARTRETATVDVVHVVSVPNQSALEFDAAQRSQIVEESERRLDELVEGYGEDVGVGTSTIVTSHAVEEIFESAKRTEADLVLLGWEEDRPWSGARAERPIDELANRLPCDFLVIRDRGLDTSRLLLPTAGGANSDLSAEVAAALREVVGASVSLLHVVDGPEDRAAGERFLREWANNHDLDDADLIVDDSGDVEGAIAREAADHTMIVIGATRRGLLARVVSDSLHLDVIDEVDCSVVMAERPGHRSIFQRLFGR